MTSDPHLRFHTEICEFENWVRIKDTGPFDDFFEAIKQAILKGGCPQAKVMMFGSASTYLAVPGSDIDILVMDEPEPFSTLFNKVFEILHKVSRF